MKYYAIRTHDQKTIEKILAKQLTTINIEKLTRYKKILKEDDVVFLKISGDDALKKFQYLNTLVAIGRIVQEAYDIESPPPPKRQKLFKIDVELEYILSNPVSADDLYCYPETKNSLSIGASTKGMPNQAIGQLNSDNKGEFIIKALLDMGVIQDNINNTKILKRYKITDNKLKKTTEKILCLS